MERRMRPVRIIPCLDIKEGRAVKGVQFVNIIGQTRDPAEAAAAYCAQGADELVFRDITATVEQRATRLDWVKGVKEAVNVSFTVGGGIKSLEDMESLFSLGVDKVFINTMAVLRPDLVKQAVGRFGRERIIAAIDAKIKQGDEGTPQYEVVIRDGNEETGLEPAEWARVVAGFGVSELILVCKDRDGTRQGYELPLIAAVSRAVDIPVIAGGGAGGPEDFYRAVSEGKADAVMAVSVFHFNICTAEQIKSYLREKGVPVL
jgi:cyclase